MVISDNQFTEGGADSKLISSVADLRELLLNPLPPSAAVRESLTELLMLHQYTTRQWLELLEELKRGGGAASASAELLLGNGLAAPGCFSAAFLRPAKRVRQMVAPVMFGLSAAIHVRACVGSDTCTKVDPHATPISMLRCAHPGLSSVPSSSENPLTSLTVFASSDR